jgi:hypothetical protein
MELALSVPVQKYTIGMLDYFDRLPAENRSIHSKRSDAGQGSGFGLLKLLR